MTLNGKIDKNALLRKCKQPHQNNLQVATNDLTEEELIKLLGNLWSKYTPTMLCTGEVGSRIGPARSSQFVSDGGGDSFLAVLFVNDVENMFGEGTYRIPIEIILEQTFGDVLDWFSLGIQKQKYAGSRKNSLIHANKDEDLDSKDAPR